MAQISLFEKRKNYSDKDITVTVGMNDQIYITFRHYSWKLFTNSDYVRIWVEGGQIKMKDGLAREYHDKGGRILKLVKNIKRTECETARYLKINGKLMPDVLALAESMNGKSFNFPVKVDEPKQEETPQTQTKVSERITKVRERVTSEELAADFRPKLEEMKTGTPVVKIERIVQPIDGFIEVLGVHNERLLLRSANIRKVCEVVPGARFAPSHLIEEEKNAKTLIFSSEGVICTVESYEEVVGKIRLSIQGGPET
ncbi:MAG: hypothetical protein IIZ78_17190 [Clostridiales bacterium]|nr:hypothetical protein [Clostridiales bacterium]